MIKPTELRIGNYVVWNRFDNPIIKIYGVSERGTWISTDTGTHGVEWNEFEPITLTEELLLKCGYIVGNEYSAGKRLIYAVNGVFNSGLSFILWKNGDELTCVQKHIKYLHQLQNLYHALTGEELELPML